MQRKGNTVQNTHNKNPRPPGTTTNNTTNGPPVICVKCNKAKFPRKEGPYEDHVAVCGTSPCILALPSSILRSPGLDKQIKDFIEVEYSFSVIKDDRPLLDLDRWNKSSHKVRDFATNNLEEGVVNAREADSLFAALSLALYQTDDYMWSLRAKAAKALQEYKNSNMKEHLRWYRENGFGPWLTERDYIQFVQDGTMWGDPLSLRVLCEQLKVECVVLRQTRVGLKREIVTILGEPKKTIYFTRQDDHYNILQLRDNDDISDRSSMKFPIGNREQSLIHNKIYYEGDIAYIAVDQGQHWEIKQKIPGSEWHLHKKIPKSNTTTTTTRTSTSNSHSTLPNTTPSQVIQGNLKSSTGINMVNILEGDQEFKEALSYINEPTLPNAEKLLEIFRLIVQDHRKYNNFDDDQEDDPSEEPNILTMMVNTLRELDLEMERLRATLDSADNGLVLFIGYTGNGKTSLISQMLVTSLKHVNWEGTFHVSDHIPEKRRQDPDDIFKEDNVESDREAAQQFEEDMKTFEPQSIFPVAQFGSSTSLPYYISYGQGFAVKIFYKPYARIEEVFSEVRAHLTTMDSDAEAPDAVLHEACSILGLSGTDELQEDNLFLPIRFKNRLGAIRTFTVNGSVEQCMDELRKFLLYTTVGNWSHWGTIRKVEVLLPAPCLKGMTLVDAPGFSEGDVYHMKVLRECLEHKCHALVHVVTNKAIPGDCSNILTDAGVFNYVASNVERTKLVLAFPADKHLPNPTVEICDRMFNHTSETINPKVWWKKRLAKCGLEEKHMTDSIKTISVCRNATNPKFDIENLTRVLEAQYQSAQNARVKDIVLQFYHNCLQKIIRYCREMADTTPLLEKIKKDKVGLPRESIDAINTKCRMTTDELEAKLKEEAVKINAKRIKDVETKLKQNPYKKYVEPRSRTLYNDLKAPDCKDRQIFSLLMGEILLSFPSSVQRQAKEMVCKCLLETSTTFINHIVAMSTWLASKKRDFRREMNRLIEHATSTVDSDLSAVQISKTVRETIDMDEIISKSLAKKKGLVQRVEFLVELTEDTVKDAAEDICDIVVRKVKLIIEKTVQKARNHIHHIGRDLQAINNNRELVLEFQNSADMGLFKRTMILACKLAHQTISVFGLSDELKKEEEESGITSNDEENSCLYYINLSDRALFGAVFSTRRDESPDPESLPFVLPLPGSSPAPVPATAPAPVSDFLPLPLPPPPTPAPRSRKRTGQDLEGWRCINCNRTFQQCGRSRRRLKDDPELMACATCGTYYNKHRRHRPLTPNVKKRKV